MLPRSNQWRSTQSAGRKTETAPSAAARASRFHPRHGSRAVHSSHRAAATGSGRELDGARQGDRGGGLHPIGEETGSLEPDPAESREAAEEREKDVVVGARSHVAVHRQEAHGRRDREGEERIAARLEKREEEEKESRRAGDGREQPRRAVEPAGIAGDRSRPRQQRRREKVIERRMLRHPVAHRGLLRVDAHPVRHDVGRHDALPLQRKALPIREVGNDRVVPGLVRHIPERRHPEGEHHRLDEKEQRHGSHGAPGNRPWPLTKAPASFGVDRTGSPERAGAAFTSSRSDSPGRGSP